MPDISNWSSDDVQKLTQMMGIKLKEKGSGYVTKQSIKANDSVNKSSTLTVEIFFSALNLGGKHEFY